MYLKLLKGQLTNYRLESCSNWSLAIVVFHLYKLISSFVTLSTRRKKFFLLRGSKQFIKIVPHQLVNELVLLFLLNCWACDWGQMLTYIVPTAALSQTHCHVNLPFTISRVIDGCNKNGIVNCDNVACPSEYNGVIS